MKTNEIVKKVGFAAESALEEMVLRSGLALVTNPIRDYVVHKIPKDKKYSRAAIMAAYVAQGVIVAAASTYLLDIISNQKEA